MEHLLEEREADQGDTGHYEIAKDQAQDAEAAKDQQGMRRVRRIIPARVVCTDCVAIEYLLCICVRTILLLAGSIIALGLCRLSILCVYRVLQVWHIVNTGSCVLSLYASILNSA